MLFDRYSPGMLYFIYVIVRNKEDAEDIMMKTFGKAFTSIDLYAPEHNFSTWLYAIAKNNIIDFIRKKKRCVHEVDYSYGFKIKDNILDPKEKYIESEKINFAKDIIKGLSNREIQIINYRIFEKLKFKDIGNQLGMNEGTARTKYARAREKIRKQFFNKYKNHEKINLFVRDIISE